MKPLTKSLHTITAVKNVALFLHGLESATLRAEASRLADATYARSLTRQSLAILGYDIDAFSRSDATVQRCIDAVALAITLAK